MGHGILVRALNIITISAIGDSPNQHGFPRSKIIIGVTFWGFSLRSVRQWLQITDQCGKSAYFSVFLFCDMDNYTKPFLPLFLGSEAIFIYDSWMPEKNLGAAEKEKILRKVMHVIQEQFTGFVLGKSEPGLEIFITAKRPSPDIRQSVQVLYAKVPRSSFELALKNNYRDKIFKMPLLTLSEQKSGACLDLDPPLLDFILMRSRGEIGSELNPSYFDRIYRFKSLVENEYRLNELELLKLNSDGSFETIKFSIDNERLQVI